MTGPGDPALPAAQRGSLTVRPRAVTRTIELATAEVPTVAARAGGISRVLGRDLPRAEASVDGTDISATLYVGALWPTDPAVLAGEVEATVAQRLSTALGLRLRELKVVLADVATDPDERPLAPGPAATVPGRVPRGVVPALPGALIAAVLALCLAGVGIRELLIVRGVYPGAAPWLANLLRWLSDVHGTWYFAFGAGVLGALGLLLLATALAPRSKPFLPARPGDGTATVVWMRPDDLARAVSAAVADATSTTRVQTLVSHKRIRVRIRTSEDTTEQRAEHLRTTAARAAEQLRDGSLPGARVRIDVVRR